MSGTALLSCKSYGSDQAVKTSPPTCSNFAGSGQLLLWDQRHIAAYQQVQKRSGRCYHNDFGFSWPAGDLAHNEKEQGVYARIDCTVTNPLMSDHWSSYSTREDDAAVSRDWSSSWGGGHNIPDLTLMDDLKPRGHRSGRADLRPPTQCLNILCQVFNSFY